MTRRELLQSAAMAAPVKAVRAQSRRPNVVIFVADDLGWRDVGYNGAEIETPNIDHLGRKGLQLDRFHSFPLCSPSRADLMTGRHPVRFGLAYSAVRPWSHHELSIAEKTIADVFRESGYQTACIGKWHLGHTHNKLLPQSRGFEYFYGHMNGAIVYFQHTRNGAPDWQRNGETVREEGYSTDLLAADAVRWIEGRDQGKPFLLYLPWNGPHSPLQAPEDLLRKYAFIKEPRRRAFAAMVDAMDRGIGTLLSALERGKLTHDTIVLFVSDNGGPRGQGANNGELRAGKATVFEGGLRVPAVLHWPGNVKGWIDDRPGGNRDGRAPNACRGCRDRGERSQSNRWAESLAGADVRSSTTAGRAIFAVQAETGPKQHALRSGDWKYIRIDASAKRPAQEFLFEVTADPEESISGAAACDGSARADGERDCAASEL